MMLTFQNGLFVFQCTFAEKDNARQAGLLWHGGNCRPGCRACAAGLGKVWWTFRPENAARLISVADESAKAALAGVQAKLEASKAVDADIDVPCPSGLAFLPYQKAGVKFLIDHPATLLGDEMGLGKTIQVLGLINADTTIKNVLVLCPATLRLNWLSEAKRWLTRSFNFHIIEEKAAPPTEANFVIVNYDKLVSANALVVHAALMQRKWDLLVSDECHLLRNPDAQRTIAVLGVTERKDRSGKVKVAKVDGLIEKTTRKAFLTGTPIVNRPIELHPLVSRLAPVEFGNFFMFAKRYAGATQGRYGWDFSGASHLDELQDRMRATCLIRRLKREVLTELPPKRRQVIVLPANGAAGAIERERQAFEVRKESLEILSAKADLAHAAGEMDVYKDKVAALQEGYRQTFAEIAKARHDTAIAKIPQVIEHLDDMLESTQKVIVFCHHHDVSHALKDHFGEAAVVLTGETSMADRQAAVDRFQNDPECKVFIGGIQAAGVGLTLTAASHVVFAELDWVPGNVTQAEDRAHRIGQKDTVFIQHLVLDGSLDAKMAQTLVAKQDIADRALDKSTLIEPVVAVERPQRPTKYPEATIVEKIAVLEAMRFLAARCDGAYRVDGAGFNKVDTFTGKRLASLDRPLTNGETFLGRLLSTKYKRQLPESLLAALGILA